MTKKFIASISNPVISIKEMSFSAEKEEILLSNALKAYNSKEFKSLESAASYLAFQRASFETGRMVDHLKMGVQRSTKH